MTVIAAFAGTGKTTFAAQHPDYMVDFVSMPYKYHLPEVDNVDESCKANPDLTMRDDWPHNYVEAIKEHMHKRWVFRTRRWGGRRGGWLGGRRG
jgi:hypothetical protein